MDPLKEYKPEETGTGMYLKFKAGTTVKLRVLTRDPIVGIDNFGNTRYNFVVWNWDENKAQIMSAGKSILNQLIAIHVDEDYDNLQDVDVKITATGEKMEREYNVMPLPKSNTLTKDQIEEAATLKLEERVNGVRMSDYNKGERPVQPVGAEEEDAAASGYEAARAVREKLGKKDELIEDPFADEPVNLDDIPFN